MQRLRRGFHWLAGIRYGQDTDRRMQRILGVAGIVALAIIVAASALPSTLTVRLARYPHQTHSPKSSNSSTGARRLLIRLNSCSRLPDAVTVARLGPPNTDQE